MTTVRANCRIKWVRRALDSATQQLIRAAPQCVPC